MQLNGSARSSFSALAICTAAALLIADAALAADGYIENIKDYCYSRGTNIQPRELVVLAASPFGSWYCETPQVRNATAIAKTQQRALSRCNGDLSSTQKRYGSCAIVFANGSWQNPNAYKPLTRSARSKARIVLKEGKTGNVQSLDGFIVYRTMHFDGSRTVSVVSDSGHDLCSGKYYLTKGSADLRLKCFGQFTFNTGRFQPQRFVNDNGAFLPVFEKGFKRGRSSLSIAVTE